MYFIIIICNYSEYLSFYLSEALNINKLSKILIMWDLNVKEE